MTNNYVNGFLTKCAEQGIDAKTAMGLLTKQAGGSSQLFIPLLRSGWRLGASALSGIAKHLPKGSFQNWATRQVGKIPRPWTALHNANHKLIDRALASDAKNHLAMGYLKATDKLHNGLGWLAKHPNLTRGTEAATLAGGGYWLGRPGKRTRRKWAARYNASSSLSPGSAALVPEAIQGTGNMISDIGRNIGQDSLNYGWIPGLVGAAGGYLLGDFLSDDPRQRRKNAILAALLGGAAAIGAKSQGYGLPNVYTS